MNEEKQDYEKIDLWVVLSDIVHSGRRLLWLLVVLIAGLSALFGWRDYRNYVPQYQASSTFTVNVANPLYTNVISYNSMMAQQMADTFPSILSSGVLQDRVMETLGLSYLPAISASVVPNANIFTLTVTSSNPALAQKVLDTVIAYYPDISEFVLGPTQLTPLSETGIPQSPINPLTVTGGIKRGIVLGTGIWLTLLMLAAFANATIHNESDLRRMTNIPCQATLPLVKLKKGTGYSWPMLLEGSDRTGFSDSIRLLSLHVETAMAEHGSKVMLISSAIPGEGKTTVAANLAAALAAHGKKALIVDLDLRNPSVHQAYNLKPVTGLTSFLASKTWEPAKTLTQISPYLYAIFAGTPTKNSTRLLKRKELRQLIDSARRSFDYILLDTPPCGILADAGDVADMADTALLVIRQNYSSRDQILEAAQYLTESKLPILGCVLNSVRQDFFTATHSYIGASGYGYGYGYRYGYGYGYGEHSHKKSSHHEKHDKA